jgi:ACS family D-galactonate transporter-like MFS transporter
LVIGLHAFAQGFVTLLLLRVALGVAVAPSFACATQTVHRVLPFKDRARAIGLLYMGNSLGSSICPPLAVMLATWYGWRGTFIAISLLGFALVPIWVVLAFAGRERPLFDAPSIGLVNPFQKQKPDSLLTLARDPRVLRGSLVVAAAAPVTTVMLLWGAKYLIRDHGLEQNDVGRYLWLPALLFGLGSVIFGELRARSSRTRASLRPPRRLVAVAACLSTSMAVVPLAHGPWACVIIASIAMAGSGGLYSLATSDMLAHAPRGTIPATAGFTTLTQSSVYIIVSPIIGKVVETTGSYTWVLVAAGLAVIPGTAYWLFHTSMGRPSQPPESRSPR